MENKKSKPITEEDVLKVMIGCSFDIMSPIGGTINLVNIADLLGTSRYRVKKHIDEMKKKDMVELVCLDLNNIHYCDYEDEYVPPYWGYKLINKAFETDLYKKLKLEHDEAFNAWLESCNDIEMDKKGDNYEII